jgi:outer membrane protein OmpA-like peptidoglycan-associated protein
MRPHELLAILALSLPCTALAWPADTSWAPVPGSQLEDVDTDRTGGGSFLEIVGTSPDPALWWAIDADTVYLRIHVVENPSSGPNLDNGGWAVTVDDDAVPSIIDHVLEASTSLGVLQWFDNSAMQAGLAPPLTFVAALGSFGTGEVRSVAVADSGSGSYLDVQIGRADLLGFGIADDTVLHLGVYTRDPLGTPWLDVTSCNGTVACLVETTTSEAVAIDGDLDGLSYIDEGVYGTNADDSDSDDDGLSDGDEVARGTEPLVADSDGDGLSDGLEAGVTVPDPGTDLGAGSFTADADPASTTDPLDADTDNGGLTDAEEDRDGDGLVGAWETDPNDPFDDADTDGDGIPDTLDGFGGNPIDDVDSDGDGIDDATEGLTDTDLEGTPDFLDDDSDGDGVPDSAESGTADGDGDGLPDFRDPDSDGDGVPDGAEAGDANGDGVPDGEQGGDTDGDGTADWLDDDPDGDGLDNETEGTGDTDEDGLPDAVDPDSDGDGLTDLEEGDDDEDCDGIPDFQDDDPLDSFCDSGQPIPGVDTGLDTGSPSGGDDKGAPDGPFAAGSFTGGACNTTHTGTSAITLLLGALLVRRRRRTAAVGVAVLGTAPAMAQEINAQRFAPVEDTSRFAKLEDGDVGPALSSAFGAWLDYANDPLVFRPATGPEQKVLEELVTLDLTGSYTLGRVRIGAVLPVHLVTVGFGVDSPTRLGDLGVDTELCIADAGPLKFGAWGDVGLPTGDPAAWVGAGMLSARVGLSALASAGPVAAVLDVGVASGTGRNLGDLTLGPGLVGGLGAAVSATDRLDVAGELDGGLIFGDNAGEPGASPLEWLLTAGYDAAPGTTLKLGGGSGLTEGVGAPDARVVLGITYTPWRPSAEPAPAPVAQAVAAPAPAHLVVRAISPNGEPIPHATVRLIGEGDGAQKTGPDGILETSVPAGPHEIVVSATGWAQGKTVVKADAGGQVDLQVVLQPTSDVVVDAEGGRIYLQRKVFFEVDQAALKVESLGVLDRLIEVLVLRPDITKLRVEGHTDSTGDDQHNLELSQARAESVVSYLVKSGIAADRLEAKGFGETRPLQAGDSPDVLATNRRVEFHILSLAPPPANPPQGAPE